MLHDVTLAPDSFPGKSVVSLAGTFDVQCCSPYSAVPARRIIELLRHSRPDGSRGEVVEVFGTEQVDLTEETREGLQGRFVDLSAGVTHYELRGPVGGPPVVLIHGNAAPYVTWDNTIDDLCGAGLRVLRYDVFGHGFSDRPRLRTYDRDLYNTQLTELLSSLDIPSPIRVVGTSQGGAIGTCFAAENPGKVERLALLAPFFDKLEGPVRVIARVLRTPVIGELFLKLLGDESLIDLSEAVRSAETRAALEREVAEQFRFEGKPRAFLANFRGDGLRDAASCYQRVKDQAIPVLLAWGTLDQLAGASMKRLRRMLPDIEYHEIEGAGHLAHYEFPERINPSLVRFLTA